MQTYNLLYEDKRKFEKFVEINKIRFEETVLICIHTSVHTRDEAVFLANNIKEVLPNAKVIGTSACAIVYEGKVVRDECLVSIHVFNSSKIDIECVDLENKTAFQIAEEMNAFAFKNYSSIILTFFSDFYNRIYEVTGHFNSLNEKTKLVGGLCSDISDLEEPSYVFTVDGSKSNSLLMISISGDALQTYTNVNVGHEPIGDIHTITEVRDEVWVSVDDVPAVDWFKNIMGVEKIKDIKDVELYGVKMSVLSNFPVVLSENHGASRFLDLNEETNEISQYFSITPAGTKFKISYLSPLSCVAKVKDICNDLKKQSIETMMIYTCSFREIYMNSCIDWELTPFKDMNICGALMFGEIGNIYGHNTFFNGSCSMLTLAERKDSYRAIDMSAFFKMNTIEEEGNRIINNILMNENKSLISKSETFREQLISQQNIVSNKVFLDNVTGVKNMFKYFNDNQIGKYDKICFISMEKGSVIKNYLGEDKFNFLMKANIGNIKNFIEEEYKFDKLLTIYKYDSKSFFIAGDSDVPRHTFLNISKSLFANFGTKNLLEEKIACVNQFAVVIDKCNLIEKALLVLNDRNQDSQERFFVYSADAGIESNMTRSLSAISVINEAIENDLIDPWFQPIKDNKTGNIVKFESLMRIKDLDGNVYLPNQFLDSAKEYHLYFQLTTLMIKKVLELFEDREESISINLSAYDINSPLVKDLIFSYLRKRKLANNIVFEMVESENFQDLEAVLDFVEEVRQYGVKISIDDFGSGYSNLVNIAQIKPDFIKIDGSIIKNILHDKTIAYILDTIVFLSEKIGIDLVAEFVENKDIQQVLEEKGIRYSQGYYISRPLAYSEIDNFLYEFKKR